MTATTTKLKKGMKAFTYTNKGKSFHLQSTKLSPMYPQHAKAFKIAADMILDSHEAAVKGSHHDTLLYPVLYLYRHVRVHAHNRVKQLRRNMLEVLRVRALAALW
jgi:hypothetical protein